MRAHSKIQKLLYEYLSGELNVRDKELVAAHLALCARCSAELKRLKEALETLDRSAVEASETRPPEFWSDFAAGVERRIQRQKASKQSSAKWLEAVEEFFVFRRPLAISLGSAVVVVFLAVGIWSMLADRQHPTKETAGVAESDSIRKEMSRYFRKSKTLLVGITNMKIPEHEPVDFSAERRASQELVHQARYLKNQPIDVRSARLIEDMEKILIELANLKENNNLPNVEIVRAGIHQENLLFKIRMAETQYDTARFVQTGRDY